MNAASAADFQILADGLALMMNPTKNASDPKSDRPAHSNRRYSEQKPSSVL